MNFIYCDIVDNTISFNDFKFELNEFQKQKLNGYKNVIAGIRPEFFNTAQNNFEFCAPVVLSEMLGSSVLVYFKINNSDCSALLNTDFKFDKQIKLGLNTSQIMFFDAQTEKRIL